LVLGVICLAGCRPDEGPWLGEGEVAKSDTVYNSAPQVAPDKQEQLAVDNAAFALDLYKQLSPAKGNLFFSPYSISTALAMTYAGARGETEAEMARALHFTLPQNELHPAFNRLGISLGELGKDGGGRPLKDFRLDIANALWGQRDYKFLPEFLDVLATNYDAGMRLVNFKENSEGARKTINRWVSEATQGKISDLIPEGLLNNMTRLVLTNAVYFKASWLHPFEKDATRPGPFTLPDAQTIQVPMMHQSEHFRYGDGEGCQAVELPYKGGLAMVVLLPKAGTFAGFEQQLTGERLEKILGQMNRDREVELTLPKFKYDASLSLAKTLAAMGMPTAFGMAADFSGMDGEKDLFISAVIHKAMVAVDEAGTEAAAATAVVMELKSAPMPSQPVVMKVDRPFIFLIRDSETGAILFLGRVVNPKP